MGEHRHGARLLRKGLRLAPRHARAREQDRADQDDGAQLHRGQRVRVRQLRRCRVLIGARGARQPARQVALALLRGEGGPRRCGARPRAPRGCEDQRHVRVPVGRSRRDVRRGRDDPHVAPHDGEDAREGEAAGARAVPHRPPHEPAARRRVLRLQGARCEPHRRPRHHRQRRDSVHRGHGGGRVERRQRHGVAHAVGARVADHRGGAVARLAAAPRDVGQRRLVARMGSGRRALHRPVPPPVARDVALVPPRCAVPLHDARVGARRLPVDEPLAVRPRAGGDRAGGAAVELPVDALPAARSRHRRRRRRRRR
mmetsp:Transcript_41272/g.127481  ORF Transcript_41272/g.127481 Transcript_41272/m.127481 type:complete len:313 (+) Transcript_41272:1429-2367(+)